MIEGPRPYELPPPLPQQYRRRSSFPVQAAIFCLWSPLLALLLSIAGAGFLRSLTGLSLSRGQMLLCAACVVVIFAGLLFGLLALSQIRQHGRKGILGRAVTGLALNCVMLVLVAIVAVGAFDRARQRARASREALARVHNTTAAVEESARRELLDPKHPSGPGSGSARVQQIETGLEDAARTLDGSQALVLKASASYVSNLNVLTKNYEAALKQLHDARVLATDSIHQKQDFQARRQMVEHFLEANQAVKLYVQHGADNLRLELESRNVPSNSIQSAMKGYHMKADLVNPLVVQIRETDDRIGKGMLGALNVLEENWGKWRYQTGTQKVRFNDAAAKDQYTGYLSEINQASVLQRQLQSRLAQQITPTDPTSADN